MTLYCYEKWNKNKKKLEQQLREGMHWNECDYLDLVKLVVEQILNDGAEDGEFYPYDWDQSRITQIDNGHYQGTLLFLIPTDAYQPMECDYLMTYVGYGSCSGCDTLQAIQEYRWSKPTPLSERQVKDFMALCKDIVSNMIKPYNNGWRYDKDFEPCEVGDSHAE